MTKRINFSEFEIYFVLQLISLRTSECRALLEECQFSSGTYSAVRASLKRWLLLRDKLQVALHRVDFELTDVELAAYSGIGDF